MGGGLGSVPASADGSSELTVGKGRSWGGAYAAPPHETHPQRELLHSAPRPPGTGHCRRIAASENQHDSRSLSRGSAVAETARSRASAKWSAGATWPSPRPGSRGRPGKPRLVTGPSSPRTRPPAVNSPSFAPDSVVKEHQPASSRAYSPGFHPQPKCPGPRRWEPRTVGVEGSPAAAGVTAQQFTR